MEFLLRRVDQRFGLILLENILAPSYVPPLSFDGAQVHQVVNRRGQQLAELIGEQGPSDPAPGTPEQSLAQRTVIRRSQRLREPRPPGGGQDAGCGLHSSDPLKPPQRFHQNVLSQSGAADAETWN